MILAFHRKHFEEIANIDYKNLDINNSDEMAYMQVVEYVRMAVLMAYAEFSGEKTVERNDLEFKLDELEEATIH